MEITDEYIDKYAAWRDDWCLFAKEVLNSSLDAEQRAILSCIQKENMVAVCSGTARGKDYIAAVACLCFMYLTPTFDSKGNLVGNTKVAMTAPTDRQVKNIMYPEVVRLYRAAKVLPGRLTAMDIRTDWEEWFLTGFKASKDNQEAWSGFHAVNTMFVVTEASGMDEEIYKAIEGNLQGNSKLLIVFNPNITTGYAAKAMKSPRFHHFRLDSLTSPNVIQKKLVIPGQVDYQWVKDKVKAWCEPIKKLQFNEAEGDFKFDDRYYRPSDLFRIKVRGMFPKVSEDVLIPQEWIEIANENWRKNVKMRYAEIWQLKLGADIAGMGRDASVLCHRSNDYVASFESYVGEGLSHHMQMVGRIANILRTTQEAEAFIDTIGEGAGIHSRLDELGFTNAYSCKFSYSAKGLTDASGEYEFVNMRAYLFWCVRDWLNPMNGHKPCLPPDDTFTEEATEIRWKFKSDGKILIESKEDIKKRLKRSTDKFDSLANTFYPYADAGEDFISEIEKII